MKKWKIIDEDEEDEDEDSEDIEDAENIIEDEPSQTFVRRTDAEDVKPFLETQPIDNLEQDLGNVPNRRDEPRGAGADYAATAGDYADAVADYEAAREEAGYEATTDNSGEITGARVTQARNLIELPRDDLGFRRDINMNAFRHQTMQGYPGEERRRRRDEQYTPPPPRHRDDTTGIPPSRGLRDRRLR